MDCPFPIGSLVTWTDNAPKTWRTVITPGPMKVISFRWDEGHASLYSMQFGGIPRSPGWIINVEYDPDSTDYYDPPLSLLFWQNTFQKEIHEMWLARAD